MKKAAEGNPQPIKQPAGVENDHRAAKKKSRRHPAFGFMKGTVKIAPGVDLAEPAMPEWADLIEEKYGKGNDKR